jgi:hypothetical protein
LSIAGLAVHYNLRVRDRRKIKRGIVRFFVAVARANRLKRLCTAAGAVEAGMRAIYGHQIRRIVAISFSVSILYGIFAFIISDGLLIDWKATNALKEKLEIAADPVLYETPANERSRTKEQVICGYTPQGLFCLDDRHSEAAAVATRRRIGRFDATYRGLIAKERAHTALTMLKVLEGTHLASWIPFPAVSLLCFNILLDLSGVLLVIKVARQLSNTPSLLRMTPLALTAVVVSAILASLSVYSYELVDSGDVWGVAAVAGVPIGATLVLAAGMLIVWAARELRRDNYRWRVVFAAPLLVTLLSLVGYKILAACWHHHFARPHLPAVQLSERADWFFYLIAAGAVLPTWIGTAFVLAVVLFGAFARALLFPTQVYVRTVLRLPTPVMVTLTAAPAALTQMLVST